MKAEKIKFNYYRKGDKTTCVISGFISWDTYEDFWRLERIIGKRFSQFIKNGEFRFIGRAKRHPEDADDPKHGKDIASARATCQMYSVLKQINKAYLEEIWRDRFEHTYEDYNKYDSRLMSRKQELEKLTRDEIVM